MSSGLTRGDGTAELQGSGHLVYAGEHVLEGSASVLKPGTQQQLNEMQSQFGNTSLNDRDATQ